MCGDSRDREVGELAVRRGLPARKAGEEKGRDGDHSDGRRHRDACAMVRKGLRKIERFYVWSCFGSF